MVQFSLNFVDVMKEFQVNYFTHTTVSTFQLINDSDKLPLRCDMRRDLFIKQVYQ